LTSGNIGEEIVAQRRHRLWMFGDINNEEWTAWDRL